MGLLTSVLDVYKGDSLEADFSLCLLFQESIQNLSSVKLVLRKEKEMMDSLIHLLSVSQDPTHRSATSPATGLDTGRPGGAGAELAPWRHQGGGSPGQGPSHWPQGPGRAMTAGRGGRG